MEAIRERGLLPRDKGGFNPVTLSYLTVVLPGDMALLTVKEAVAFPHATGRRQQPLSKRVLVYDLYGTPLYQPSVGHLEPGQQTVARAAVVVIEATGANPKFLFDRAVTSTKKPQVYKVGH